MSWLNAYAEALEVDAMSEADIEAILDLARQVAHGSERKNAPPAAYLAAAFVAGGGELSEAISRAGKLLGDA
jgi:hypothetical protein